MGAAAGAHVRAGELGDAHGALQRLFAAVGQDGQLRRLGIADDDGVILPDVAVGPALDLQHALPGNVGVVVDGDGIGSHVEAGVVAVVGAAQHAGDDMLAGVLLHVVKAALPVDLAGDGLAHGQRLVAGVIDHAVRLMNVPYINAAQRAVVGALSAALGVEGGAVQPHPPRLFVGGAVQHRGVEPAQERVLIV